MSVTPTTNYLSYAGLAEYDRLLKIYIGEQADTTSLHTVKEDEDARKIYFYKEAAADITDSTAPAFTIDYSDIDTMIGDLSTLLTTEKDSIVGALNEIAGADTVAGSFRKAIKDAVEALDTEDDVELVSVADDVVTIKAIKEVDGIIAASEDTTKDVVLAKVAKTGTAADVAIVDEDELLDATNVEDAIAELAGIVEDAEAAGKVTMETLATATDGYLKTYQLFQGVTAEDTPEQKAAKSIGLIDIPRDYLVTKFDSVKVSAEDDDPEVGFKKGDKYITLYINTKDADPDAEGEPMYIKVSDFAKAMTTEEDATSVQLTISDDNVISAVIAEDAVGADEIADGVIVADHLADSLLEQFPGIIPLTGEDSIAKLFETASDPTP